MKRYKQSIPVVYYWYYAQRVFAMLRCYALENAAGLSVLWAS